MTGRRVTLEPVRHALIADMPSTLRDVMSSSSAPASPA